MENDGLKLEGVTDSTEFSNIYGIQGEPNSGKTTSGLTFPNPIVLDLDKKLPARVRAVPFWDDTWVRSYLSLPANAYPNRRDAIKKWIRVEGPKIPENYTLMLDSWTALQNIFDLHAEANSREYFTKKSQEVDGFAIYAHKIVYSAEIMQLLKALKCNVVITFHEQAARDKQGNYTGKARPLMTGQFSDQLAGHCGNLFRQVCIKDEYYWQVKSNDMFNAVNSPHYKFPPDVARIKATWEELQKYKIN